MSLSILTDKKEREAQSTVVKARDYYGGKHSIFLNERQKAWLKEHGDALQFRINMCSDVVDSLVDRLKITGFAMSEGGNTDEKIQRTFWKWWQDAGMGLIAHEASTWASRDGEAFVLVDWDTEQGKPKWILHPRYTDPQVKGDGYGMWMEYPNSDYLLDPIKAVKQWTETIDGKPRIRRTEYYPNAIMRYFLDSGEWKPLREIEVLPAKPAADGQEATPATTRERPWPEPWVDRQGNPLGIPVAHLHNPGLKSDLEDAIPIQDILNKHWLDLIATADSAGFPMLFTFGFVMTTDGKEPASDQSNLVKITPGNAYGTKVGPGDADVKIVDPAKLEGLLELEERIVFRLADVTDTPMSRFQTTRQIASAETLKQQEATFVDKILGRQELYGRAWNYAAVMAVTLASTFADEIKPAERTIEVTWGPAQPLDDKAQADTAKVHKELGIPEETLWSKKLGYSAEEIEQIKQTEEYESRQQIRANLAAIGGNQTTSQKSEDEEG